MPKWTKPPKNTNNSLPLVASNKKVTADEFNELTSIINQNFDAQNAPNDKPYARQGENWVEVPIGGNPNDSNVIITSTNLKVIDADNQKEANEQIDDALLNARSTGIRFGGRTSVNGGLGVGTSIFVTAGSGQILDNTDAENPTFTRINWTDKPNVPVNDTGGNLTWYYFDDNSDVIKSSKIEPTPEDRRTRIYLVRTSFTGGAVTGLLNEVTLTQQTGAKLAELLRTLGDIKILGLEPSFSGTALRFRVTAGLLFGGETNYQNSYINPNQKSFPIFDTAANSVFRYATTTGVIPTNSINIDVARYQVNGVPTNIPGSIGMPNVGVHFIWLFSDTGNIRVTYDNSFYNSIADARTSLQSTTALSTTPTTGSFRNAFLLGAILAPRNATNLQNQGVFVATNRFGLFGGGLITPGGSFLEVANNLSDLLDIAIARTNLEVYSKQEVDNKIALFESTGTTILFDRPRKYGYPTSLTGTIAFTFDFTNAVDGTTQVVKVNSATEPTFPASAKQFVKAWEPSVNVYYYMTVIKVDNTPTFEVHVTSSVEL